MKRSGVRRWRRWFWPAAALLAIQLVPVDRNNPEPRHLPEAPADALAALRANCFDCHSHETQWPWYSRIAPASWLVSRDVENGRASLNFSRWQELTAVERRSALKSVSEAVSTGTMPPFQYLLNPAHSRPTSAEIEAIKAWAQTTEPRPVRPAYPSPKKGT